MRGREGENAQSARIETTKPTTATLQQTLSAPAPDVDEGVEEAAAALLSVGAEVEVAAEEEDDADETKGNPNVFASILAVTVALGASATGDANPVASNPPVEVPTCGYFPSDECATVGTPSGP
jgi:hypothetical protein